MDHCTDFSNTYDAHHHQSRFTILQWQGNSPPPFSPRLTDQLELFGRCSGQLTKIAKEVKDGSPLDYDPKPLKRLKSTPASSSLDKSALASSPYPKKTTGQCKRLWSHSLAVSTSEESSESSDNDNCSSTLSEGSKIPKPPREPGCQDQFSSTILLGGPGMQGTNEEVSPDTSWC